MAIGLGALGALLLIRTSNRRAGLLWSCAALSWLWLLAAARTFDPIDNPTFFRLTLLTGGVALVAVAVAALRGRRATRLGPPILAAAALAGLIIVLLHDSRFVLPARVWILLVGGSICASLIASDDGRSRIEPRAILILAVWFALATALFDNGWRGARRVLFDPMLSVNCDSFLAAMRAEAFWVVPLSHLLAFALLGSFLAVLAWRRPELVSWPVVFFCLTFFVGLCLGGYFFFRLGTVAIVLFALVFAAGATNECRRRPEQLVRLARRSAIPLLAVQLALAVGAYLVEGWQQSGAATARSAPTTAPNVILITLDTVRPQNLSVCGYARRTTPELERLAARGLLFDRAFTTAPWTLPTHASLMTGALPRVHQADIGRALGSNLPTLAEIFREHGYATAGFVANEGMCGAHTGLGRGFARYDDHQGVWQAMRYVLPLGAIWPSLEPAARTTAADLNDKFVRWLDEEAPRPFFGFLNYYDAHAPYFVPAPEFDRYARLDSGQREHYRRLWQSSYQTEDIRRRNDANEQQLALDTYDASLSYLDHELGRLMRELDKRGLGEQTYVVITTDHGEHFGEHGVFNHGNNLYRQEIQAPLLICGPGIRQAARINRPVSLLNVPATILDLAGLPVPPSFERESLMALSRWPAEAALPPVVSELGAWTDACVSVVEGKWHYVRTGPDGREEIYDLDADPLDDHNLIDTPTGQQAAARFRELQVAKAPRQAVPRAQHGWSPRLPFGVANWFSTPPCCGNLRFGGSGN